jgi:lipid II:glycine glycyltransferase (peptidoglycan interpeptide bridge formation enzyme)
MNTPIKPKRSTDWDQQVEGVAGHCYFLQSDAWANVKAAGPWTPVKAEVKLANGPLPILVYWRRFPGLGRIVYVPKICGLKAADAVALTEALKSAVPKAISIKLELDQPESPELKRALRKQGWRTSQTVQYSATVQVNLRPNLDDVFMSFKSRARWETRRSEREGVEVEKVPSTRQNLGILYDLMCQTSERGNFTNRSFDYSMKYWLEFSDRGQGRLYFARYKSEIVAASFVIIIGQRAYYKDSGSIRTKPDVFATRLLQWRIMCDLKEQGVVCYDLMGVPNPDGSEALADGLTIFKTAYSKELMVSGTAYDLHLARWRARAWRRLQPRLLWAYFKLKKDLWY